MNAAIDSLAVWLLDFDLLAMLMVAASLITLALLRQPAQRLAVTKSTFVALLLLAALCALPGWSVVYLLTERQLRANGSPVRDATHDSADNATVHREHRLQSLADDDESFALPATISPSPTAVAETRSTPAISWTIALVGMHAIGALGISLWLAIGSIAAHRLRRSARPAPAALVTLLGEVANDNDRRSPPAQVLVSNRIDVAVALGVQRPAVLLPSKWIARRTPEDLRAVLAHECAHVRNHDLHWLALSRILLVLLWIQPHYWLLRRRMRLDQEALADAAAADISSRQHYAEQLVTWARDMTVRHGMRLSSAVGLWEGPSQLRQRIALLVDDRLTIFCEASRKWRLAALALCALSAVALSLFTLEPRRQSRADEPNKPPAADSATPPRENPPKFLRLRVVDESGAPIGGATVKPNGLRAENDGSHYGWFADMEGRGAPEAATTDDAGIARVRYPTYIDERRRTHIVTLRLVHPEFVAKGEEVPVAAEEPTVTMARGGVLEIEGVVASQKSPVESLHAVDHDLETAWTRLENRAIQSPPLAAGRNDIRVVWFPADGPTHFSRVEHFDLRAGERKKLQLELLPGTRLVGELAGNVPRPVMNGKVVTRVDSPGETDWLDWTEIKEDGSFEFESLPRDEGEIVQLIAICDGFASKPPPGADSDPPYAAPQTASLGKDTVHHVMEMIPTAKCVIELRDPDDQPVVGARVTFNPNVKWMSGGSSIFAHPLFRSIDIILGKKTWSMTPKQWRKEYPYQAISDEDGTAHLMNLPPFAPFTFDVEHDAFELPIIDDGRQSRTSEVKLHPGLISVAEVTLQPKGTDYIGEGDRDAASSDTDSSAAPIAPVELAGQATAARSPATAGTLLGRFVFDGTPPKQREVTLPVQRTRDGRELYSRGQEAFEKHRPLNESLIVGDDGGIANVFIWVRSKDIPTPSVEHLPPITVSLKDGRYAPHAMGFQAPRELVFKVEDDFPCNFFYHGTTSHINRVVRSGEQASYEVQPEPLPVHLTANIQPWLSAWLLPLPHPYSAVSGSAGSFRIENLPPGRWEFAVWHEQAGFLKTDAWPQGRFAFDIKAGVNDLGSINVSPTIFKDTTVQKDNATAGSNVPDSATNASPNGTDTEKVAGAASRPVELTFIIAQHVILHDGKIIEWADIERMLNEHPDPKQAHPTFEFTHGALPDREEEIREKIWTLRKDVQLAGHSWSSVLPRASARYDAIRTAVDLIPNEDWRVEGVVETVDGAPIAGAEVVLCPPVDESLPYKTLDIYLRNNQLREPVDEIVTHTDADGRFAVYPPPDKPYYLVALARKGFGLVRSDEFAETKRIETRPWARIQGRVKSDIRFEQSADIVVRIPETGGWPELSCHQYTVDLEEPAPNGEFEFAYVPPGLNGWISRSIKNPDGGSFGLPYQEFELRPGETLTVKIDPPADSDLKQLEELQRDSARRRSQNEQ